MRRHLFIVIIFITVLSIFSVSIVVADDLNEVDKKIEEQNKKILEEIEKNKKDNRSTMDKMYDMMWEKDSEEAKDPSLSRISSNLEKLSIRLALGARKFIVPITIITLLINTIMLSTVGTKSLKKRKKYLYGSFMFYIFFLIILNFPIYLIWRYSIGEKGFISFNGFYTFSIAFSNFFKEHSFMFSIIIFSYGIINYILSDNDIPRRLASSYLIKMSAVMFVVFQTLPWILKLAL